MGAFQLRAAHNRCSLLMNLESTLRSFKAAKKKHRTFAFGFTQCSKRFASSLVVARLNHGNPSAPGNNALYPLKKLFFFVRTCASSSFRPDRLICLSMSLFYHLTAFSARISLCGVALEFYQPCWSHSVVPKLYMWVSALRI